MQQAIDIIGIYETQGYKLPDGLTREIVEEYKRSHPTIDPIFVPLASAGGATAWGVPFIDGRPLRYELCMACERPECGGCPNPDRD